MRREVDLRCVESADIDALAANLRDQDRAELQALGYDPAAFRDVIRESVEASCMAHSIWSPSGELMGVCGMAPVERSVLGIASAAPWMLGTPVVPRFGAALNRATRRYNARMLGLSPLLFNYVHARNTVSVAWLQRVGFTLKRAEPLGPHGEPFHRFEMRRAHV